MCSFFFLKKEIYDFLIYSAPKFTVQKQINPFCQTNSFKYKFCMNEGKSRDVTF